MTEIFVKYYGNDKRLSRLELEVLHNIALYYMQYLENTDYNTNQIQKVNRFKLAELLEIDLRTLRNILYRLRQKQAIIKHGTKEYVNPYIMCRCNDDERDKLIKLLKARPVIDFSKIRAIRPKNYSPTDAEVWHENN